ncbi:hypothetical protein T07_1221 [Trichinella nelsoni]|uniref:Uncharacterized protein n=1 Tax=Trichinella nelsoni TaxID=6336 RepID=A0A0V0SNE2_9BILA|nr:hypothetical protein T07_1221 [Trichinella nelsoni]
MKPLASGQLKPSSQLHPAVKNCLSWNIQRSSSIIYPPTQMPMHEINHRRWLFPYLNKDGKMTGVLLSRFRRSIPFPADGQFY